MVLFCLVVIFLVALGIMERKGIIDEGEFAVVVVFTLFGVAGYMGLN